MKKKFRGKKHFYESYIFHYLVSDILNIREKITYMK
jgi:hypothetical protein